jgi:beta-glucosidase
VRHGPAAGQAGDDAQNSQSVQDCQAWVELTLTLHNRGARSGAEVEQVYLEPPAGGMERPRRTLVAFRWVELAAEERRPVSLAIPLRRLACFDTERDGSVLEAGVHRLVVAWHAGDPGLAVELELAAAFIGP